MPDTLQTNLGNFNKKQVSHPRDDPSDCGSTKDGSLLITAPNSSCGKVMFSQACVIPSVQWGRGGVCLWVWGCMPPDTSSGNTTPLDTPPPPDTTINKQTVRILLESYLLTDAMPCLVYDGMVLKNLQVQFYLFNLRKANFNVKTLLK